MNVVEKEAVKFYKKLCNPLENNNGSLEGVKDILTTKLYSFNRDRNKLDFLKVLRQENITSREEHMKVCKGGRCNYEERTEIRLFAIDQEIEEVNSYYTFEAKDENKFSVEEEASVHNKLNEIIEELKKQGFGQQVIFEELEDLKSHFNLGKKNWHQLFQGKLGDLISKKILDKTIVTGVFNILNETFEESIKIIDKI